MSKLYLNKAFVMLAAATVLPIGVQNTAQAYDSPVHTFTVNDVRGGWKGSTFGSPDGASIDPSIICGILGGATCPAEISPWMDDKSGVMMYPVDSEFGFYVVDFVGAQGKARDGDYLEGFVGNIMDAGIPIGLQVSNAPTVTYKVKPPLGTWCQGLGGTTVKCETEHYVTMEHLLSCHEIIPYFYADPVTGMQGTLATPDGSLSVNCGTTMLDDVAYLLDGGLLTTERLVNPEPCVGDNDPDGCQMYPNDKTSTQDDVAKSTDYSVQLKDDGKALYGWGGKHKRPNDIRLYARLQLPDEWKADDAPADGYTVTNAQLVVNHWITNNPNDQLRPEDLENEAATGRKPSYKVDADTGVWKSLVPCYEGDGDFIDTEEGAVDPTFIGVGTYLKNTPYALPPDAEPGYLQEDPPYAFSSDLYGGFTNAFYTTINRDPFEWSYDSNPDPMIQDFVGSPLPDDTLGELVSGPRWRLKPNKFGQDLPSLEIPLTECSAPPFAHDNIKYVVGTPVTTVINLLDWNDDNGPSPLVNSKGWIDVTQNHFVEIVDTIGETPITSNGLPMSEDFDLAVYIKGDKKPTAIYNAQLIIEYDGEIAEPTPDEYDVVISSVNVPGVTYRNRLVSVGTTIVNDGPDAASGDVTLQGTTSLGVAVGPFTDSFVDLAAGSAYSPAWNWTAPSIRTVIYWTATVTAADDTNPANNTGTGRTKVR